jgi:hypothetical protein
LQIIVAMEGQTCTSKAVNRFPHNATAANTRHPHPHLLPLKQSK